MITIVDYGVGNLFSIKTSFDYIGEPCEFTSDADRILGAERILLPGVGAFGDAVNKLHESKLFDIVKDFAKTGKPMMGICLGMQLLFEKSYEYGEHEGLSLLPGEVLRFTPEDVGEDGRIPHSGWNSINIVKDNPLLKGINENAYVYYVHSYFVPKNKNTIAETMYGNTVFSGSVNKDNIFGTQFHPEKSGDVGLKILKNFSELKI